MRQPRAQERVKSDMSWTDERIELLKKLWEQGLTASQIADELGGVSRNAVIGKAHRLDLKSRPSPVKSADVEPARNARKSPVKAPLPRQPRPQPIQPSAARPAAQPASAGRPAPQAVRTKPDIVPDGGGAADAAATPPPAKPDGPKLVSIGPGGFIRQGPGDQQAPIPPAPPRRRVPAKPSAEIAGKTSLLDLNERICRWPMGHPGEADFHFCGQPVNPGYPYCVEHCGRAFQAQLPRGTRRPPPPPPFGGPRVR